eukprot:scaffold944_cov333-Pavlova_lutheri.AAC.21
MPAQSGKMVSVILLSLALLDDFQWDHVPLTVDALPVYVLDIRWCLKKNSARAGFTGVPVGDTGGSLANGAWESELECNSVSQLGLSPWLRPCGGCFPRLSNARRMLWTMDANRRCGVFPPPFTILLAIADL